MRTTVQGHEPVAEVPHLVPGQKDWVLPARRAFQLQSVLKHPKCPLRRVLRMLCRGHRGENTTTAKHPQAAENDNASSEGLKCPPRTFWNFTKWAIQVASISE